MAEGDLIVTGPFSEVRNEVRNLADGDFIREVEGASSR